MRKTTILSGVILAAATITTAQAEDVSFDINRSDLATEQGTKRVYAAMSDRAERMCGVKQRQSIRAHNRAEACAADLVDQFVASIDNRFLTALHGSEDETIRLSSAR